MMRLRTKVIILAAIFLVIAFVAGIVGNSPSSVLAQGPKVKVRAVQIIAADAPRFVIGETLARFHHELPEEAIEALIKAHGARTLSVSHTTGYHRIAVPPGMPEKVFLKLLTARPEVAAAQLNHIVYAFAGPSDPDYSLQWHYTAPDGGINVVPAWGTFTGPNQVTGYNGSGVTVAVIDTGLAYKDFPPIPQAPEWEGQQWKVVLPDGVKMDLANQDFEPNDDNGHGTHVSNTISQNTSNGLLGAGVANGARIMPIKVLDDTGSGTELAVAEGVRLAANNGAHVINMSLGFPAGTQASDLQILAEAVTYAYGKGVTIVAAAGNDSAASCSYPAAFPEVICVGATKYDGNLAWYSNYGTDLELVAPGGAYCASANDTLCLLFGYPYFFNDQNGDGWPDGVLQETFGPDYTFDDWFYEGTSMASPHVAAVAALVIGKAIGLGFTLTPDEVRHILTSSARDKGVPGYDSAYGWGLVDAYAAVAQVGPTPPTVPLPPTGLTTTAGNGTVTLTWSASTGATSYNVYRGTTSQGEGSTPINTGITATTYTDTTVINGTKYFYKVSATNSAGTSGYSNEASATPVAPVLSITGGPMATASRTSARIQWTTSVAANSVVSYGTTSSNFAKTVSSKKLVTAHSLTLSSLQRHTKYYYNVSSTVGGATVSSAVYSFTTQ